MNDFSDYSHTDIQDIPTISGTPIDADPVVAPAATLDLVRAYRAPLLSSSDWTQGADSPLSDEKKAEWSSYRQALRDLTNGDKIILPGMDGWPTPPSA